MVKRGFYTGQGIPLGYKVVPAMDGDKPRKKYAIDEEKAPLVKKIFSDFVDGLPPVLILEWMKEQGIKTKTGKTFDYNTLYRLLNNDFYIGTRRYNAKESEPLVIPNAVPPIIDEQTFDAVKHIFLSRRTAEPVKGRKSNRNRLYYLTGKAVCAKCGGSYLGKTCANVPYYMCKNRLRRKECDCMSIQKKHIEPAVFRAIRENIFSEDSINEIIKVALAEVQKSPIKEKKSKSELVKRKNVLIQEIAELTQMKLSKEINQEVFVFMKKPKDEELAEIEMSLLALEHQQKTVVDETFIRNFIDDLFQKAESGNDELMKYVIDSTVEKVVIGDSEVVVYLAISFGKPLHKRELVFPSYSLCKSFPRKEITKRISKKV
jgi:site-specific DNA recombinase